MDSELQQSYMLIAANFVFILLVFLILRELVMWYWKINERTKLMKKACEQNDEIITLLRASLSQPPNEDSPPKLVASRE